MQSDISSAGYSISDFALSSRGKAAPEHTTMRGGGIDDTQKKRRDESVGRVMMRNFSLVSKALLLVCVTLLGYAQHAKAARPVELRCDSLQTPLGDDTKVPLLSWKLQDDSSGAKQT